MAKIICQHALVFWRVFLGGMRAIIGTQITQYIVVLIAYMIPVMWLSTKHTNNPIPQIAYGSALLKLSEREKILATNQQEQEVRTLFKQPANEFDIKLQNLPKSWEDVRIEALHHVEELKTGNASLIETKAASRALTSFPKNIDEAKQKWAEARAYNVARAEPVNAHMAPFFGKD